MAPARGRQRRRAQWPADRPDYTQFVLYKQNLDTPAALSQIANSLYVGEKVFGFAGMKDKRGVTAQLCTAYHVEPERLAEVNKRGYEGLAVGGFSFRDTPLRLGDNHGNNFTLVIRCITKPREDVAVAVDAWSKRGFVNYFGLQRFGTSAVPTHHIGRAALKHDWDEVVSLIMRPREGEWEGVQQARRYFADTKVRASASRSRAAQFSLKYPS